MDFPDLSSFRMLVAPGLHGSNEAHWQSRWQRLYPAFERITQERWDEPDLAVWAARVTEALNDSTKPTLVVAHSFGCLATLAGVGSSPKLAGALLVAPADPVKFGVAAQMEQAYLPCPAVVVGSHDDPWMEQRRAAWWAAHWGCDFVSVGAAGHINAESGLGDWPFGLQLLDGIAARAQASLLSGTLRTPSHI